VKRLFLIAAVFLLSISIIGCSASNDTLQTASQDSAPDVQDEQAVTDLVKSFGDRLKSVSLLAPKDTVVKSIEENYGNLVTPELLEKWKADPQNAPGRLTSSPWPERIDIKSVKRLNSDAYEVQGEVIEVTSVEVEKGGAAASRPITLGIKRVEGRWLIDSVTLGEYQNLNSAFYPYPRLDSAFRV